MDNQLTTVDDFVIDGFTASRDLMMNIMKTNNVADLADFAKVLAAMRTQPESILENATKPVIMRMFQEIGADPQTEEGRAKMLPFMDNLALAVQDAHHVILGQVEQQRQNQQALMSGRPQLLKG